MCIAERAFFFASASLVRAPQRVVYNGTWDRKETLSNPQHKLEQPHRLPPVFVVYPDYRIS